MNNHDSLLKKSVQAEGDNRRHTGRDGKLKGRWHDLISLAKRFRTEADSLFEVSYSNQLIKLMVWNVSVPRR